MMAIVPSPETSAAGSAVIVKWSALPACGTPLDIRVISRDPTSATVQLIGEIDVMTAGAVGETVSGQVDRGRRFVRLDVSGLTFCDGAGLSAIVRAHNELLSQRGTLVLTGVSAALGRLLRLTHLDEALFVADGPTGSPHVQLACSEVDEPRC